MTTVFETTDVSAARRELARLYETSEFTAQGEHPYMRIKQDALGPVRLDRLSFGMRCDVDGSPLRNLYLGHVTRGNVSYRHDGGSARFGTGDVFLAAQPGAPFLASIDRADLEYTVLDRGLVAEAAATADLPARPVRFTADQPATHRDTELWLSTCRFVRDTLASAPERQPLLTGPAARLLAATVLAVFPNDGLSDHTEENRRDACPATVRRAVSFIDDNAHRDITPADIAAAACVSTRALQLAFRRHLECTPTAYLRRVRLENARRQLTAADPERETVTAVAYRWGFPSPSRFAAYYRHAYGTHPSQTLGLFVSDTDRRDLCGVPADVPS